MNGEELARAEVGALRRAQLDGLHGALDSSVDAPVPCQRCLWCHTQASPAAAVIPTQRTTSA